jgi:hypothetical protein
MASKGSGFFAIDRRTWAEVCGLGINPAVAYLVLAQGTSRNNRLTSWSVTSLRHYVGISWERGKPAIEQLIKAGIICHAPSHSKNKPRYDLLSWAEIFAAHLEHKRACLSDSDKRFLAKLRNNEIPAKKTYDQRQDLKRMAELGVLHRQGDDYSLDFPPMEPDVIWLPNTIVTGTDRGEESPVRRVRSGGDVWTLRLFVDLYHAHNLRDDGGISPRVIFEKYERKSVGQQGIFNIWAFRRERRFFTCTGPFVAHAQRHAKTDEIHPVWENVDQLAKNGLLTFVPHLWESDSKDAEVLHAYGIEGISGEQKEIEIGQAAHLAGQAMVLDAKVDRLSGYYLAPVKNTLPNVQMVGVVRLTYRPHTSRTANWFAELNEKAPHWIQLYRELHQKAEQSRQKTPVAGSGR